MSNPLMGMLGGMMKNSPAGDMQKIIGMMKRAGDPGAMLQNMAQSDPAIKKAMEMCQGRNPQQVFMEQCQTKGVNPQQLIDMMK